MRLVPTSPEKAEILERFKIAEDLVPSLARQIRRAVGPSVGLAELISCGNEGLLDAARRFDPTRQVPFRSYAYLRIRGAILDGVRAIMPLPRRMWEKLRALEAAQKLTESRISDDSGALPPQDVGDAEAALAEHLAAMTTAMAIGMLARPGTGECSEPISVEVNSPEQLAIRMELTRQVEQAIETLPTVEGILVRRHYLEGQNFGAIAKDLGLSKSWASRLHRRAMERLAESLQET